MTTYSKALDDLRTIVAFSRQDNLSGWWDPCWFPRLFSSILSCRPPLVALPHAHPPTKPHAPLTTTSLSDEQQRTNDQMGNDRRMDANKWRISWREPLLQKIAKVDGRIGSRWKSSSVNASSGEGSSKCCCKKTSPMKLGFQMTRVLF